MHKSLNTKMIKIIRVLLGICVHEYEEKQASDIMRFGNIIGYHYIQECKHCNKLRSYRFNANEMN